MCFRKFSSLAIFLILLTPLSLSEVSNSDNPIKADCGSECPPAGKVDEITPREAVTLGIVSAAIISIFKGESVDGLGGTDDGGLDGADDGGGLDGTTRTTGTTGTSGTSSTSST